MSEYIPVRKIGDRVQVMNTTEAKKRSIVGWVGTVTAEGVGNPAWRGPIYEVTGDDGSKKYIEGSMLNSEWKPKKQ